MASVREKERIRYRYGICLNENCPKCKAKDVQEISARKELVCTECGKPLRECPPPKPSTNYLKYVIIAIVVVAIAAGICFLSLKKQNDTTAKQPDTTEIAQPQPEENSVEKPVLVKDLSINEKEFSLKQGDSKQLSITVVPENHDETLVWSTDDETVATIDGEGNVTAHKEGTANITISATQSGISANVKVTVPKENKTGSGDGNGGEKNPTWGTYTGQRDADGLPHGNGVLNITHSTTINGETAYPGERIEGVFRNGYVNMGTWYKKDGNAVVVKDLKVY